MISQKLSFQENQDTLNFQLLSMEKQQREKKFNIEDIGDFLPVGLLINHKAGSNLYMNKVSEQHLNMTLAEATELGMRYQKQIMYDDDEYKRATKLIGGLYERNDETEILSFFQKLRPIGSDDFEWMYITSKLYKRKKDSDPCERLLIACPVKMMGDMTSKITRALDENQYMKKHFKKFAQLTKREKEILTLVAEGYNNPNIADLLYISRHTVEKHRKNILAKIECKSFAELIRFAIAFDLIK